MAPRDIIHPGWTDDVPETTSPISGDPSEEDLSNIPLFVGYSDGLLNFAAICCVIFVVIGVPGNIVTIVALLRSRKVRNATAAFIVNLSAADLLLGCVNLPLAAQTFWARRWPHGDLLCKLFPLLRYALVAVSLLSVLAIGVNRYILIAHPQAYRRVFSSEWSLAAMVVCTWALPIALLAPTWAERWGSFGLDRHVGSCSILPDGHGRSPKQTLFVVAFAAPCAAIILCYARIFCISRQAARRAGTSRPSKEKGKKKEKEQHKNGHAASIGSLALPVGGGGSRGMSSKDRRLLQMILVIFCSFLVCYLPITVAKTFLRSQDLHVLNICAYVLVYLATCVNPFIYVGMSLEYRQAYTELLCCERIGSAGGSGSGGAAAREAEAAAAAAAAAAAMAMAVGAGTEAAAAAATRTRSPRA